MRASTDRVWLALRLYARGHPLEEIGRRLPNLQPGNASLDGVTSGTATEMVRAGLRLLLGHVLRDRPPDPLADELWPPPEVRREIREMPAGRGKTRARALRGWLEGRRAEGAAQRDAGSA